VINTSIRAATNKIILFGLISILGIALILMNNYQSKAITAQIMVTIPFAFIGGVLLLFFTDRSITVASLVGFITLCGVASRNAIMMISHYLHLMRYENESFTRDMIIRGSQERLVPVLMTASVTSLALIPLIFSKGQPGSEVLHPVAVVIVGGLLSSTILDIIVTPTIFYRYGRQSAEKYVKLQSAEEVI
jgi:Cu(I)/Ag(I) efflux system membrane protein CusA/SilA